MALFDTFAQLKLSTGDLDTCEGILNEIDRQGWDEKRGQRSWYQPLLLLTRARLLLKRDRPVRAIKVLTDAVAQAPRHAAGIRLRLVKTDAPSR